MSDVDVKLGQTVFSRGPASAVVSNIDDMGYFVTVKIDGYSSPQVSDNHDPFAFGAWFDGVGLPEWFGDLDGDQQPELLAAVPKADVSPTRFRVFRWTGSELNHLRTAALVRREDGVFAWNPEPSLSDGLSWIETFKENAQAEVSTFNLGTLHKTTAPVEAVADGFRPIKA